MAGCSRSSTGRPSSSRCGETLDGAGETAALAAEARAPDGGREIRFPDRLPAAMAALPGRARRPPEALTRYARQSRSRGGHRDDCGPRPHALNAAQEQGTRNRDMVMADTKHAPHGGYSPDMDGPAHEATYRGFVRFAEIGDRRRGLLGAGAGGRRDPARLADGDLRRHPVRHRRRRRRCPRLGLRAPAAVAVLLLLMLLPLLSACVSSAPPRARPEHQGQPSRRAERGSCMRIAVLSETDEARPGSPRRPRR